MKKLSLLFAAVAVALCASAAGQFQVNRQVNKYMLAKQNVKAERMLEKKVINQPARVITEQPEGQAYDLTRAGGAVYVSGDYLTVGEQTKKARFVFAPDGTTVYIRDLLYGSGDYFSHYWVEGTIEGNTLTVPLGQSIAYVENYDADIILCWGTTYAENETTIGYTRDESVTEVTYTIDLDNQTYTMNGSVAPESDDSSVAEAYLATGLTAYWSDDDSWSGFIEWNTVFSNPTEPAETPTIITEQPEGELKSYLRSGGNIYNSWFGLMVAKQEGKAKVVFAEDGETVYFQDPIYGVGTGNWVKGTLNGNKITLPLGQYLSYNEDSEYGLVLARMSTSVEEGEPDEDGEPTYTLLFDIEDTEVATYTIDEEAGTITLDDSDGDVEAEFPNNYIASGLALIWSDDASFYAMDFSTVYTYMPPAEPAVPADPSFDEEPWYDCGDDSGFSRLTFTMPTTDVDGTPLDQEFLSYSVYVDNETEPFVFDAATYESDLTEDMTEIPYEIYSIGYDFYPYRIYFYYTNEGDNPLFTERIGIQAIYTVDGVRNASNIVYWPEGTDGIDTVKANNTADGAIYNIMGQKMSGNLPAGIYIQNGKKFIVK